MKKLMLIFLVLVKISYGQITLENSYPGASSYYQIGPSGSYYNQLTLVRLEVDGDKYVHIDRNAKQVKLYNLNHSPFKTISYAAAVPVNTLSNIKTILYISQKLFDTDNEIEFMYVDALGYASGTTQIINEDGTVIFTANNQTCIEFASYPQEALPIYNTSAGTKMILSAIDAPGHAHVYSLPGTLSALTVKNVENPQSAMLLFPNPATHKVSIGSSRTMLSRVIVSDLSGKTLKTLSYSETNTVEVDVTEFVNGEYFVQVFDKAGTLIETKTLIKN